MNVAILMGRGIEGCGVTKCVIEFTKVQPSQVFATLDKKWPRRKAHDFTAEEFLAADDAARTGVLERLNQADVVIVYSVPSYDHPQACQDGFFKLVQGITARKALIHLDHSIKSLHNNANLEAILGMMDVVMTHSDDGVLARFMKKKGIATPIVKMGLGFDFDGHRARFWKPIEETDPKTVRWIGRTARWKGPKLILDFHDQAMRGAGYRTILEGLEASINYVIALYHDDHAKQQRRDVINKFRSWGNGEKKDMDIRHGEELYGDPAYLYPPYQNEECMERLSRSGFGSDLYHLSPNQYGGSIENCHGEIVASGAVPIFHKHFGDNVVHRVTGDPLSISRDSGTLFLDKDNFQDVLQKMLRISSDPVYRDEQREMAFEFWKAHADAPVVVRDILEVIERREIDTNLMEFFK